MGLFSHHHDNDNTTQAGVTGTTNPGYGNAPAVHSNVPYQDQGMGLGQNQTNNAVHGGPVQGSYMPNEGVATNQYPPSNVLAGGNTNTNTYGDTAGTHPGIMNPTGQGQGMGTTGPLGGTAGQGVLNTNAGGMGHPNTNNPSLASNAATAGMNTNNMGSTTNSGMTGGNNGPPTMPSEAEAKRLERSGKMDKILGTLIGSTTMKQEGIQKQAEGAALRQQSVQLAAAEQLEAEAQMRRGQAVGYGAHPHHAFPQGPGGAGAGPNLGGSQAAY